MSTKADTRQRILDVALKLFAQKGYSATSVRDIVTAARVSKPVLYYYFANKADLYRSLVTWAADERLRIMRESVESTHTLADQLKEMCAALFEFASAHSSLIRLAFSSITAAPGEVPPEARCLERWKLSLQFLENLFEEGRQKGSLNQRFDSHTLAMGFIGLMHLYVLSHLLESTPLDRSTAEVVVNLFFLGVASDDLKTIKI